MSTRPASTNKKIVSATSNNAEKEVQPVSRYELAILYHPDLEVDLTKAEEKVVKIITEKSGKIVSSDNWGKKKLAYPIKKQDHAVYIFYTVELLPQNVGKVEAVLNITEEVIRYMIIRPDLKAIDKAAKLKVEKAEKAALRNGSEDSEDKDETKE